MRPPRPQNPVDIGGPEVARCGSPASGPRVRPIVAGNQPHSRIAGMQPCVRMTGYAGLPHRATTFLRRQVGTLAA
jgi:hypothetical protein